MYIYIYIYIYIYLFSCITWPDPHKCKQFAGGHRFHRPLSVFRSKGIGLDVWCHSGCHSHLKRQPKAKIQTCIWHRRVSVWTRPLAVFQSNGICQVSTSTSYPYRSAHESGTNTLLRGDPAMYKWIYIYIYIYIRMYNRDIAYTYICIIRRVRAFVEHASRSFELLRGKGLRSPGKKGGEV